MVASRFVPKRAPPQHKSRKAALKGGSGSFTMRPLYIVCGRFPFTNIRYSHESARTEAEIAGRSADLRGRARDRERIHPAEAGHDVRDPQAARRERCHHFRQRRAGSPSGRFRLPPFARGELPTGARRHLCLAKSDPALRSQDRRYRRGADPLAQGRRALFRPAQGQPDQFRGSGAYPPPDQFRQPHPPLSGGQDRARGRRSDQEGSDDPHHRPDYAARQRPAGAYRRPTQNRQDDDAAGDRALDQREPSGSLPDRSPDRRAARGSHRHAALGEGRGHQLDLRRAGVAPRPGRRDGDREGEAPRRAQARRGDPARFHHPARARLQHRRAELGQGADRRRRRQRVAAAEAVLRGPRATSRRAARSPSSRRR